MEKNTFQQEQLTRILKFEFVAKCSSSWASIRIYLFQNDQARKLREGVHTKKNVFKRALPRKVCPPPPRGATGKVVLFFRPSKTTFKRVLRNQIPIENDEYDDDDGDNFDNFDAYDDDNAQKSLP